ncbi:IS3 family transposase [Rhodohalobacter sp.]|uniref:IS3 family transposase n=1 Tax=Rhodohalobacter sp. TaxID=1974210 RepID=UPI003A0FD62D
MYDFIESHRHLFPVEKMCKVLKVSRNAYYYWRRRSSATTPESRKQILKRKIKTVFDENRQIYGSYKITKELHKMGVPISRSYVGRLMKEMGIRSRTRKKFIATTDSSHENPIADNVLDRDFNPSQLGKAWVSDITYVRLKDHWAYLTIILDLADRAVVGWSLSTDLTAEHTVVAAWADARRNRSIRPGFLLHSDRGVQYTCTRFADIIFHNKHASQSMSRKGNCWDNAVAESFFKSIKYEELNHHTFNTYGQLQDCVKQYIQWYNTKRIHSSLDYKTPLETEIEIRNQNRKWAA